MNYDYKIEINSVTEFKDGFYNGNWSFITLSRDFCQFENHYGGEIMNCFKRTRNWVIENHLELLL